MNQHSAAKVPAYWLQHLGADVVAFLLAEIKSGEGRLHGVYASVVFKLFEQGHSRSGFLVFLNTESAVLKWKVRTDFS